MLKLQASICTRCVDTVVWTQYTPTVLENRAHTCRVGPAHGEHSTENCKRPELGRVGSGAPTSNCTHSPCTRQCDRECDSECDSGTAVRFRQVTWCLEQGITALADYISKRRIQHSGPMFAVLVADTAVRPCEFPAGLQYACSALRCSAL